MRIKIGSLLSLIAIVIAFLSNLLSGVDSGNAAESARFAALFLQSLSIAILVSVVLLMTLDVFKTNQLKNLVSEKVDAMSKNVFEAALSVVVPKTIISHAIKTIFDEPIYRDNFTAAFKLLDDPTGLGIVLEILIEYDVVNDGSREYYYETGLYLSGIGHEGFSKNTSLNHILYKYPIGVWDSAVSEEDKDRFNEELLLNKKLDHHVKTKLLKVSPHSRIKMSSSYQMWKEKNANHIFRSRNAGTGFDIKLRNEMKVPIVAGLSTIHRNPADSLPSSNPPYFWHWKMREPSLPENGFVVYWRHQ